MTNDEVIKKTKELSTEHKASALATYKYFVKAYANKNHQVLLRDGEDTFTHFTTQFVTKFINDNKLKFDAESYATANNSLNYANINLGMMHLPILIDDLVKKDEQKSSTQIKKMTKDFSSLMLNVTQQQWQSIFNNAKVGVH